MLSVERKMPSLKISNTGLDGSEKLCLTARFAFKIFFFFILYVKVNQAKNQCYQYKFHLVVYHCLI